MKGLLQFYLQKISDTQYIRVCTFNKIYYYQWQVELVPDEQRVPDKWRDACKLPKFIKFGVVSYINIIIIKKGWQCKAGRERLTPYQSKDPNPATPTHRMKEEKGKTAGINDRYVD